MLGWINNLVKSFVIDTFGEEAWQAIVARTGIADAYVSTCPYSDSTTYR